MSKQSTCNVPVPGGCPNEVIALDMCRTHYDLWRRNGKPENRGFFPASPLLDRLDRLVMAALRREELRADQKGVHSVAAFLAERSGLSVDTWEERIRYARKSGFVPEHIADEFAAAAGIHERDLWPDWCRELDWAGAA